MKNKGFTLIELLAVIVILAIIALIAVPIVLNIIDNSKKSANQRSVELYVDAVEKAKARYMAIHPEKENITFNDIKDLIEYSGETVECDTIGFDADGNVYATKCKINNTIVLNDEGEALEIGNVPLTLAKKIINNSIPAGNEEELVLETSTAPSGYKATGGQCEIVSADQSGASGNLLSPHYIDINGNSYSSVNKEQCENISNVSIASGDLKEIDSNYQCDSDSYNGWMGCLTNIVAKYKYIYNPAGLVSTSENTEDNKTTYYFKGNTMDNYVSFAGFIWKIVRINEDGSIRLVKNESIGNSEYNVNYTKYYTAGYTYGDESNPYANTNDSTIKTVIDSWYENNLQNTSYEQYISDSGFCAERPDDYASLGQYGTWHAASNFSCPNKTRDLYTVNNEKGNKYLKYPIGLLSAKESEFTFVGEDYYHSYIHYYSMSSAIGTEHVSSIGLVYPVINLKSDTLYTSGTGTQVDPYIVG